MNADRRSKATEQAPGDELQFQFDVDTHVPIARIFLSVGFIACSVAILLHAELSLPIMLLLIASLPIAVASAWASYRPLQMRQPIVAVGRRGVWDRRLGVGVIPWSEIRRMRLGRNGGIILDPVDSSSGFEASESSEPSVWQKLRGRLDPARRHGSLRIGLADVVGGREEFLTGLDASLPAKYDTLWPEEGEATTEKSQYIVFAGLGAMSVAALLIVATGGFASYESGEMQRPGWVAGTLVTPGDRETAALAAYKAAAKRGDATARVYLGLMYYEGDGVARDPKQSAYWFRLAAGDEMPAGQAALGYLYEFGVGVDRDLDLALSWYEKAAEKDNAWAQHRLGLMYRDGKGVFSNSTEAVRLLRAAAIKGDVAGQYHLAEMYEKGMGVPQDWSAAAKWYRKAAGHGHHQAAFALGVLYQEGRGLPRDPARAVLWFEQSAQQGNDLAQHALAAAYEVGRGVKQNLDRAALWYALAAYQGNREAAKRRSRLVEFMSDKRLRKAEIYQRKWMSENLLAADAEKHFKTYRKAKGPKAFAVAANGAWAKAEGAEHARDAVHHALTQCRKYAPGCVLYAVGDEVVAGMREGLVDAEIARQFNSQSEG